MAQSSSPSPARLAVARALMPAAERYPDLDPVTLDTAGLEERDARLAVAILRTALQRWMTIEHLLDRDLRQPMRDLEPALRAVLLVAGAQLVFMDRLPARAVVDEAVRLARRMVRPGATGLTNAVLRRLAERVQPAAHGTPWMPAADRLPLDDGYVPLREATLPDPAQLADHLTLATSHPRRLVQRWLDAFGPEAATAIALHGIQTPPTIVAAETPLAVSPAASPSDLYEPHRLPGFVVWHGAHAQLVEFLAGHPARRVQDPASARAVAATAALRPRVIIDYCAGRGTKTVQLAAAHPDARIFAADVDPRRLADLRRLFAGRPLVTVVEPRELPVALGAQRADFLLLDVPCSNTGVLGRRPEARYRFTPAKLESLVALQRDIARQAIPLLAPAGCLLYSTCSLERAENQDQAAWIAHDLGATVLSEQTQLPGGAGPTYANGAYHALLRKG